MTAVLRLERKGTLWRAHRQTYDVVLDGAVAATVANGEAVTVAIPEGHHVVWLATIGRRSAQLNFSVRAGEMAAYLGHPGTWGSPALEPDRTEPLPEGFVAQIQLRRPA
jgi:hypothetical protein